MCQRAERIAVLTTSLLDKMSRLVLVESMVVACPPLFVHKIQNSTRAIVLANNVMLFDPFHLVRSNLTQLGQLSIVRSQVVVAFRTAGFEINLSVVVHDGTYG